MQGDVMKESMNVAKTLSWKLFCNNYSDKVFELTETFKNNKLQGIHIHVPEGATPKDGPSAGTAITVALYSLFTNKKINNKIAITGEICLQGKVRKIGGLDKKILGGIDAGVKIFIFPKENHNDFILFKNKHTDSNIFNNIKFIEVDNIEQVLDIVFIE
jgi:ATP-dependent Lon protease